MKKLMPHNQLLQNHGTSHNRTRNNQPGWPNDNPPEDAKLEATEPNAAKPKADEPDGAEDLPWLTRQKGGR